MYRIFTRKKIDGTTLILEADILEKKSKLRTLFEKNVNLICIPFYPDNYQTLNSIALKYFKEKRYQFPMKQLI